MATKRSSSDKWKKIVLAVLGVFLAAAVLYSFVLSGDEPRTARRPQNANASTVATTKTAPIQTVKQTEAVAAQQAPKQQEVVLNTLPLSLPDTTPVAAKIGSRNIFAYYVEPPPRAVIPNPPPIGLQSVLPQTAVAGTPRSFTMTVSGTGFPADAVVYLDGAPRPSKRLNANTLSVEITPGDYASQRQANVEVKSESEPAKFWSHPIPFIVQPAPEPPFKYIGRIGDKGLFEMTGTKELTRLKKGSTIAAAWRIDSITDAAAEVTQTQYDIKRRIAMQEKAR
ncbi:MAG TPA: IPT/TIG domain-containing protein [Blastocatellia bacterium]|nr:IPT/TIG domain-containing protein [Blastocatellia bacterium]